MRRTLLVLVATLALADAAAAQDWDFKLSVRVRLEKLLPDVTGGVVLCVVGSRIAIAGDPGPLDRNFPARVGAGVGTFSVDRRRRSFDGNVDVTIDADQGRNPATATHYKCWLQLNRGADSDVPRPDAPREYLIPRPDAPSTLVITGEVPR